jgi:outer membrane receptor protein involved in Fe transport
MRARTHVRFIFTLLAGASGLTGFSTQLAAQGTAPADPAGRSTASSAPTDIVVTAQRREQRLQDVPVSVSVISGATVSQLNLTDLAQIAERQPNLRITPGPFDQLNVRGIGSANNVGFEQSVGTFVDGVYRSRARAVRAGLFDIERVEVLKGPQTTFFGNNAIAGALNITTRKPGNEFSYNASALYGTDDEYNIEAGVTVPLGEMLSVRAAGRLSGMNGYVENDFTGDDGPRQRNRLGRIAVAFKPSENFRSDLRVDAGRQHDENAFPYEILKCPPDPQFAVGNVCNAYLAANGGKVDDRLDYHNAALPSYLRYNFTEVAWTNQLSLGDFALNAITGYFRHHSVLDQQLIPTPIPGIGGGGQLQAFGDERYRQFQQEVRLVSPTGKFLEYQIGAYYSRGRLNYQGVTGFYFAPFGAAAAPTYNAASPIAGYIAPLIKDRTKSAFAAATVHLAPALRLNLGLRYSVVDKSGVRRTSYGTGGALLSLDNYVPGPQSAAVILARTLGSSLDPFPISHRTDKKLMPSAGVQYDVTGDLMTYATYSKGFKAGGYSSTASNGVFDPEDVDAYEVGVKGSLLDRALTFSLDMFRSDYKNLQESVAIFLPSGSVMTLVANAASARSQGVEFDGSWRLVPGLTLSAGLAYLDAKYRSFPNAPCNSLGTRLGAAAGCVNGSQDLAGSRRAYAPRFSGNVSLNAEIPVGDNVVRLNPYLYFTSRFFESSTADYLIAQDGYAKVDMRIGFGPEDRAWEIAAIGKNLTDKATAGFRQTVSSALGSVSALADRPRSVAVQLSIRH